MASYRTLFVLLLLAPTLCCGGDDAVRRAEAAARWGRLSTAIALLESSDDPEAAVMLKSFREIQGQRDDLTDQIEELLERLDGGDLDAVQEIDLLVQKASDPWAKEVTSRAASKAFDLAAEVRHRNPLPKQRSNPTTPGGQQQADELGDAAPERLLEGVRKLMAQQEWAQADQELYRIVGEAQGPLWAIDLLRRELDAAIDHDVSEVLSRAQRETSMRGPVAAHDYLMVERRRFPDSGSGARVHALAVDVLAEVGREMKPTSSATVVPDPEDRADPRASPVTEQSDAASADFAQRGLFLEREGRLNEAADAWQRASTGAFDETRLRYSARAIDCRERGAFRSALIAKLASLRALGLEEVELASLVVRGKARKWADLTGSELLSFARVAGLRRDLGLALELLALIDGSGQEAGESMLHEIHQGGLLEDREVFALLDYHRGMLAPAEDGYRWDGNRYRPSASIVRDPLTPEMDSLMAQLESGDARDRDKAYQTLVSQSTDNHQARQALRTALRNRFAVQQRLLTQGSVLDELVKLGQRRTRLDEIRGAILSLVADKERYVYPFDAQLVGPRAYREYLVVQAEIDGLVDKARRLWDDSAPGIELPSEFRTALSDYLWCIEASESQGMSLNSSEQIPSWVQVFNLEQSLVDIRNFAWSIEEVQELRLWQDIEERSKGRMEVHGGARRLRQVERHLVEYTNAYRRLLGRRPYGWNPRLHGAAAKHSSYMQATGHFGHVENSEFPTLAIRMASEGYHRWGGENVYSGSTDPGVVFQTWIRSSAHHRNLIAEDLFEVGCAQRDTYWTQVLGSDSSWVRGLK